MNEFDATTTTASRVVAETRRSRGTRRRVRSFARSRARRSRVGRVLPSRGPVRGTTIVAMMAGMSPGGGKRSPCVWVNSETRAFVTRREPRGNEGVHVES